MKRSTRQLEWRGILMGALLVLGGATSVWAQNTFPASGSVGIGTTGPIAPLTISSANTDNQLRVVGATAPSLRIVDQDPTPSYSIAVALATAANHFTTGSAAGDMVLLQGAAGGKLHLSIQGTDAIVIDNSRNVGIGTTAAGDKLDVAGNMKISTPDAILKIVSNTNGQTAIDIRRSDGTHPAEIATTDFGKGFIFRMGGVEKVRFQSDGNVGIGTTSPAAKLHVAGDAQVDGNLAAKYQDIAEWVQAPGSLPPGTVVVVDPQGHNQILPASQAYDTRAVGVISARPGLLLGEAGEGKVKVAQSGRVKVKVDASYGPIAAGDLLVTSPTPGHAMRSTPLDLGGTLIHQPGTLLGKALEQLEEGRGEILMLLTLQ